MSLLPRKKPEGLIDGCFGPSAYCSSCQYAKEYDRLNEHLCRSCGDKEEILKKAGVTQDIMDKGIKMLRKKEEKEEKDAKNGEV